MRQRSASVRSLGLQSALLIGIFAAPHAAGQAEFRFAPGQEYRPEVPTVAALIGHEIGAGYVDHATVVRACDALDEASDRIESKRYGATWAGRPLLLSIVSSPENLARWPAIENDLARLEDPRLRTSDSERAGILARTPVVVWLSFNVHGNEASGTEASLPLLYHLAACKDESVAKLLEKCVVVIDPCLNPDGRERYVQWYRNQVGIQPNPDPNGLEHDEPWPGGRVNHYWFDLNRDWAFLTQVETRARLAQYRKYRPQVHADLHEMYFDESYFFFPAATPIHDTFPPSTVRFGKVFGAGNAKAFDRHGWTYYTGEQFDLFYPGYGDSWPSLNGAIGMTYEQAGHSRSGVAVERADGTVLTLAERTAHHFTAALATIETAVANRSDLLESYARFFEDAIWTGKNGGVKEIVLVPGEDRARTADLVTLLLAQGIEAAVATEGFVVERCRSFDGGQAIERRFGPGAIRVSMAQPRSHLVQALLEPRATIRENQFYDISAWSFPLAFGVEAYSCEVVPTGPSEPLRTPPSFAGISPAPGEVPSVGYLVPWNSFGAPRFLASVLARELVVRVAGEPFVLDGRAYGRGTLFVTSRDMSAGDHEWIRTTARDTGVDLFATSNGMTERGPDLGSGSFEIVAKTSIALVAGDGTDANCVGALRWLFEQRYGLPFTLLAAENLGSADLRRYNVIVLPDGFYRDLSQAKDALQHFVESGGVLIGIRSGAFALAEGGLGLVGVKAAASKKPEGKPEEAKPTWRTLAQRRLESAESNLPGTMFRLTLDPAHPLAFGYDSGVAVLMDSTRAFALDGPGIRIGVFPKDSLLSGYASTDVAARLDDSAYLADVRLGDGHVVLFAGDPTFRGFVRGQNGLLMNALMLLAKPVPAPALQSKPR